jgi:hypothetical protein
MKPFVRSLDPRPHAPRRLRPVTAALAALAVAIIPLVGTNTTATADQPDGYGPSDPFDDSIMPDDGPQVSVRHQAMIVRTAYGYRFIGAEHNNHLKVTLVDGRLRFRDTHVPSWKSLPRACDNQRVSPGIAATCRVPDDHGPENATLIEVRPRLGNDRIDGRDLPATFEMAVLGDAGRDTLYGGKGNDYLGGATDNDRAYGRAGNDWMRGGSGRDRLLGGAGNDAIQGLSGKDFIRGGSGDDRTNQ